MAAVKQIGRLKVSDGHPNQAISLQYHYPMDLYQTIIGPFAEFDFMRYALASVVFLALSAAPVGVFLVMRRMSLVGDALSHAVLPGAAIGYMFAGLSLPAMSLGGFAAGMLMALLAGATLFIISNTIRLTVFARRKEIAIMKYVGATDWFIRWPFMMEGLVLGFFGGILASVLLRVVYYAMVSKIYNTLAFFPLIPASPFLSYITVVLLCSGMLIGALGSTISLKRFLEV